MDNYDIKTIQLLVGTLIVLIIATLGLFLLRLYREQNVDPAVLDTLKLRVRAWWLLIISLTCAFLIHPVSAVVLFAIISFFTFREYITVVPTRLADHRSLFVVYLLCIPIQFTLVGIDPNWFHAVFGISPYLIFSILIPAYVFLIIPAWIAMSGDPKRFLERIAKIQVGLLICVYCLSFVPALLTLEIPNQHKTTVVQETAVEDEAIATNETTTPNANEGIISNNENDNVGNETVQVTKPPATNSLPKQLAIYGKRPIWVNIRLLFFFVLIVQISDLMQYIGSQLTNRSVAPIAKTINSTRTWKGVLGGAATTALIGIALVYFTPFAKWWQPGLIAFAVSLMGFAGSMTMSAIKRDRGVDDYGTLIEGHAGMLDRLDSLCFAAPVYYHSVWLALHFR